MASPSSPASLRDLYAAPPDGWSFFPATEDLKPSGTKTQSPPWPTGSADSHVFDLSPINADVGSFDPRLAFKALATAGMLQYATTAIAMPFEVGKVLLQVQWIPKEHLMPAEPEPVPEPQAEEDELSDASDDSLFHDPSEPRPRIRLEPSRPKPTDEEGYVARRSLADKTTRPQFVIPIGPSEGVWGMMKRVGQLTSCTIDVLSAVLQPVALSLLSAVFMPSDPTLSLSLSDTSRPGKPLAITVASHLITGFILSPLDLVRTRLIVQSSLSTHRTYSGPVSALRDIYHKEGGLAGMYMHPNLLIPTLIENTLRPLLSLSAPLFIARTLFITEESHPIAYQAAELLFSSATLLLTLPIETARRRLQIQTRGSGQFQACVETRPSPYVGVLDVLWRVLSEERSMYTVLRRRGISSQGQPTEEELKEKSSWFSSTGISQLYRGFGMGMGASAVVFLLATLAGGDSSDAGMKQSKRPSRWPENIEYLHQSCFASDFPQAFRQLVVGPKSTSATVDTSRRIAIKLIDDPRHPACGQRGLFASAKIAPNSYILPYHGEIHCDERADSDYDLSLDRVDGVNIGVDASRMGNEARFVNDFRGVQSKPNAVFRQGRDNRGWLEMSVWSGPLPIKKGDEILVSYGKGWWSARTLDESEEMEASQT
ncbi:hypothetical protein FRC07_006578 [Ceratobasidium sp. 392]|nr:hypothetical protein FRC07_006578 [Ceratobasidium sp. 392]